jgi:hypothetical protein
MKTNIFKTLFTIITLSIAVTACEQYEDDGALQYQEENFTLSDFESLEIGDAFVIRVEQGNYFSIQARGDRRNISDLDIRKSGNTLIVRYDEYENRQYETYIDIVMPTLSAATFSGATQSVITGFEELDNFRLSLSGASVAQTDLIASSVSIILSGASVADLRGSSSNLTAEVSGASTLKAFSFPVQTAEVNVSGASVGKVTVANHLHAMATGASTVLYRGNPVVESEASGGSSIHKDN